MRVRLSGDEQHAVSYTLTIVRVWSSEATSSVSGIGLVVSPARSDVTEHPVGSGLRPAQPVSGPDLLGETRSTMTCLSLLRCVQDKPLKSPERRAPP